MDFYKLLGIPECDVEILKGTYTKTNNFDHGALWMFSKITFSYIQQKNVNHHSKFRTVLLCLSSFLG